MDIVAVAGRHPAPGETVPGTSLAYFPGGKGANQAVAAARMGAETVLLGCVGEDAFGTELLAFLAGAGVDVTRVRGVPGTTGTALIVVAEAENTIVVVPGANHCVEGLAGVARAGDVVVSQFEIPLPAIVECFASAKSAGATTMLNPAPAGAIPAELATVTDIVVVNEIELAMVGDFAGVVITTLGAAGVEVDERGTRWSVPGRSVEAVDTTGAGDCFVGALAAGLAGGAALRAAVETANTAASICVTRAGAGPSMPTKAEVEGLAGG